MSGFNHCGYGEPSGFRGRMVSPSSGAESPTSSLGDYSSRSASTALSDEGPSEAGTPLTGPMATPRRSLWDDTLGDGRALNGVRCVVLTGTRNEKISVLMSVWTYGISGPT